MNRSKLTRSPASGNVERFSSPWTIGSPAAEEFCNTIGHERKSTAWYRSVKRILDN